MFYYLLVGVLTARIQYLTEHMRNNRKVSTQRVKFTRSLNIVFEV